jgi:glycosyltransferase involved in cell wall biosynthesis
MPKVSVIIPCHNYGHYLARAVDSVLAQTLRDFELIVVDDGSSDNTKQVAQGYAGRGLLRFFHSTDNRGPSAARNLGIKNAAGEYLVFLDADDAIAPDKLARQADFLDKNPDAALVYCDVEFIDETKLARRYSPSVIARYGKMPQGDVFLELLEGGFMPLNSVMVRAACVASAGMFDESARAMEDWDLWLRICRTGRAGYIDSVLASVFFHKGRASLDADRMFRGWEHMLAKHREDYLPHPRIHSRWYYSLGIHFYKQGLMQRGRADFFNALRFSSGQGLFFKSKCLAQWLVSFFGPSLYRRMRNRFLGD